MIRVPTSVYDLTLGQYTINKDFEQLVSQGQFGCARIDRERLSTKSELADRPDGTSCWGTICLRTAFSTDAM